MNRYYIGSSSDPEARLVKHLSNHKGFTAKAKDWQIVHCECFNEKMEALARERQIKKWKSRILIENLVAKNIKHG